MAPIKGFFAYPSEPRLIPDAIQTVVGTLNKSPIVQIETWQSTSVTGKWVISEICAAIDRAQLFCIDLTGLNLNVMFELGYAIAADKRIWPIIDLSRHATKQDFEHLKILTTLGYSKYLNSSDIVDGFYTDRPYEDVTSSILKQVIQPQLTPSSRSTIFHLKGPFDNEAEIRLSKRLHTSPADIIIDDPREAATQNLGWYGKQVYGSAGVLCHLTHPSRIEAHVHNARQSLVAGIARGMGRQLLMLAEGDFLAPIDYRDTVKSYSTASEALSHVESWLTPIEASVRVANASRVAMRQQLRLAVELKNLDLGEPIAENEDHRLTDEFFIETAAYQAALRGQQRIFVGRKGVGKTANLLMLERTLQRDRSNLVCRISPAAFEIQGIARLLSRFKERDQKGFAVEGLWKYLLFTELANVAAIDLDARGRFNLDPEELALLQFVEQSGGEMQDDFSIRLESCVTRLLDGGVADVGAQSTQESRAAISEILHTGVLRNIKEQLISGLPHKKRIVILVDNLDKAWDQHGDLAALADVILGLLNVAQQFGHEFRRKGEREPAFQFNLALFLRADIYHRVAQAAGEPDKLLYYPVSWTDPESLLRVVEDRYKVCQGGDVAGAEIWSRFFCSTVAGVPTGEYLLSRIFPRPRDLLYFVNGAIAIAMNHGHGMVEESDVLLAEKEYSSFAVSSLCVEDSLGRYGLETLIIEFVGSQAIIDETTVHACLRRARVDEGSMQAVTEYLCSVGFLGFEVDDTVFRFAEDPAELRKLAVLARRRQEASGKRLLMVNRPFWAYLEINPPKAR